MWRGAAITVAALPLLSGCSAGATHRDAPPPSASGSRAATVGTSTAGLRSVCPEVKRVLPALTASGNRVLSHRAFGYRVVEISQDADPATQRSLANLISTALLYSRRDLPASDQAFLEALDAVAAQCERAGSNLL